MGFEPAPYAEACRPPFWAGSGHAQTILAHVIPTPAEDLRPGDRGVRSVDIPLPDGDRLRAYYKAGQSGKLVAIFHGLSGDSHSDYVRLASAAAQAAGHSVLAVNHRGCGSGRGLARGLYHSGRGDDVGEVFAWARRELPESRLFGVGFSLSGNALLLLLSERNLPAGHWPDGAIAINPPIDLQACSERIGRGFSRIYDLRFVRRCMRALEERLEDGLLPEEFVIPRPRSLREFDDLVTAPLSGFEDAEDYYRRCSTKDRLERIQRPTVIVHSEDDPFVSPDVFRTSGMSSFVHLHMERHGGHVGYLARRGSALAVHKWLGGAISHYLAELCATAR